MIKTRILVVDDELSIIKFLWVSLEASGFKVLTAMDGSQALQTIEMELPDLVILDITMPKMDGLEVCYRLREWSQIPIIMLSALVDDSDKVKCLDLGADDYITKPFSAIELVARIKAVLRRTEKTAPLANQPTFTSGDLVVNFTQRLVTMAGIEVKTTPTEYNLLQELVLNAGKVLTHTQLLNKVWGSEYRDEREYVHVFIRRLRNKLEPDPKNPQYFVSIPGVGYRFMSST
jgi:two-component system KDP operon response regulator KdpE